MGGVPFDTGEVPFDIFNNDETLNQTLSQLLELSWPVGEDWLTKGYSLNIFANNGTLVGLVEGNVTQNSRGTIQSFSQGTSGQKVNILFVVYS